MGLHGFDRLYEEADAAPARLRVSVMGANDPTVLAALRLAKDRGWVEPRLVGPESLIRAVAKEAGVAIDDFPLVSADGDALAPAAVSEVTSRRADALMKGRVATPALMRAVLDPANGLRTDRVICQVVLMEIPRDGRRFLLADTGITVRPKLEQKADIARSVAEAARALGSERPRLALMAATESVNVAMPETVDAAELAKRNREGEFPGCAVEGPLSFDLAYATDAGEKKRVGGEVVGAAEGMIFPDLLSANLTVKAIMYAADCRFGGVLMGASAPVVFMSRADSVTTRLNSLALTIALHAGKNREA